MNRAAGHFNHRHQRMPLHTRAPFLVVSATACLGLSPAHGVPLPLIDALMWRAGRNTLPASGLGLATMSAKALYPAGGGMRRRGAGGDCVLGTKMHHFWRLRQAVQRGCLCQEGHPGLSEAFPRVLCAYGTAGCRLSRPCSQVAFLSGSCWILPQDRVLACTMCRHDARARMPKEFAPGRRTSLCRAEPDAISYHEAVVSDQGSTWCDWNALAAGMRDRLDCASDWTARAAELRERLDCASGLPRHVAPSRCSVCLSWCCSVHS